MSSQSLTLLGKKESARLDCNITVAKIDECDGYTVVAMTLFTRDGNRELDYDIAEFETSSFITALEEHTLFSILEDAYITKQSAFRCAEHKECVH
jgi:hypothetical protein